MVVFTLVSTPESEQTGFDLLNIWCRKTDIQSCIRFVAEIIREKPVTSAAERCFHRLKKSIRSRIVTDWDTAIHHEHWNQLLSGLMQTANKVQSGLTYQIIEFLVTLLGRFLKIRVVDVKQYSKAAISYLFAEAGDMTGEWLSLCKHCGYTWINLCPVYNPPIVPILLSVSAKLQVLPT